MGTLEAVEWCNERLIEMFILPAHTNDFTQPCDLANFKCHPDT